MDNTPLSPARRISSCAAVVLAAVLLAACPAGAAEVKLGTLKLALSDSRTAQVFHIVDQLSQWDRYAHQQYVRWADKSLALTDEDRKLLQEHARLRQKRGWGKGFEQAFLVDDPIDAAARHAVVAGLLSSEEASDEAAILRHFAPRLQPLLDAQQPQIANFQRQLQSDAPRLAPVVAEIAQFTGTTQALRVPVFLVANPDDRNGGGEANAGRLVVEVPSPDPMGFLLHEALHRLLEPHRPEIAAAASKAGLSPEVLNEGIAYAFAPGMTAPMGADLLAEALVRSELRGVAPSNDYVRFYSMAIVIRPLLRDALARHRSFEEFLPEAVAKWRQIAPANAP